MAALLDAVLDPAINYNRHVNKQVRTAPDPPKKGTYFPDVCLYKQCGNENHGTDIFVHVLYFIKITS